jgi:hypothetical protein
MLDVLPFFIANNDTVLQHFSVTMRFIAYVIAFCYMDIFEMLQIEIHFLNILLQTIVGFVAYVYLFSYGRI